MKNKLSYTEVDLKRGVDFIGVSVLNLKHASTHNVLRRNGKTKTHWLALLFVAQVDPKKAKIGDPEKMDGLAWFNNQKLPNPLHSMLLEHLEMVKAEIPNL